MIPFRGGYRGDSYKLFADYNDINIFVEDFGYENLYLEIFKRSNLRIRQVFSKNGKKEVIDEAKSSNDRSCVFIVDRDWDDVLGKNNSSDNLIVLKRHSIENYMLDYTGFCGIIMGEYPKNRIEDCLTPKSFNDIIVGVANSLRPLFECFVSMQMEGNGVKGCSHPAGSFQLRNKSCAPDKGKINKFVSENCKRIPKKVKLYFKNSDLRICGHGKYMLHFTWAALRQQIALNQLDHDRLKMRIVQVMDIKVFKNLCDEIVKRVKQ